MLRPYVARSPRSSRAPLSRAAPDAMSRQRRLARSVEAFSDPPHVAGAGRAAPSAHGGGRHRRLQARARGGPALRAGRAADDHGATPSGGDGQAPGKAQARHRVSGLDIGLASDDVRAVEARSSRKPASSPGLATAPVRRARSVPDPHDVAARDEVADECAWQPTPAVQEAIDVATDALASHDIKFNVHVEPGRRVGAGEPLEELSLPPRCTLSPVCHDLAAQWRCRSRREWWRTSRPSSPATRDRRRHLQIRGLVASGSVQPEERAQRGRRGHVRDGDRRRCVGRCRRCEQSGDESSREECRSQAAEGGTHVLSSFRASVASASRVRAVSRPGTILTGRSRDTAQLGAPSVVPPEHSVGLEKPFRHAGFQVPSGADLKLLDGWPS